MHIIGCDGCHKLMKESNKEYRSHYVGSGYHRLEAEDREFHLCPECYKKFLTDVLNLKEPGGEEDG